MGTKKSCREMVPIGAGVVAMNCGDVQVLFLVRFSAAMAHNLLKPKPEVSTQYSQYDVCVLDST